MANDDSRRAAAVWPFMLLATFFFLYAAWVGYSGVFAIQPKYLKTGVSVSSGAAARHWAVALACFGFAMLGVLARRRPNLMIVWMSGWLSAAVLVLLVPAYLEH